VSAAHLLETLTARGISLAVSPDGRLSVKPRDRVTPDLAATIRHNRAELLAVPGRAGLTASQERQLRTWLAGINEDPESTAAIVDRCRSDPAARAAYLRRARHTEALALLQLGDRAFVADPDLDPVVVTIAVRGGCVVDLEVEREKWAPFVFLRTFIEGQRQ